MNTPHKVPIGYMAKEANCCWIKNGFTITMRGGNLLLKSKRQLHNAVATPPPNATAAKPWQAPALDEFTTENNPQQYIVLQAPGETQSPAWQRGDWVYHWYANGRLVKV